MPRFICVTCGTQFPESPQPPAACPICEDERQYVPAGGQGWTEMAALGRDHQIGWNEEADGVFSLKIRPAFAIAQRAFLILHPDGNILWDCVSLIDAATVRRIEGLGGLAHIAISHPHYYSSMSEWSAAFGGAPVHIHEDDAKWVQRNDGTVKFWSGERLSLGSATMIRCGGHFAGASVLHCPWLSAGRGALFSGDTIQVVPDRRHVSFMYSYPNLIPLGAAEIARIMDAVWPFAFDAIYGAFEGRTITHDGKAAVERSAERYLSAIGKA